MVPGDGNDPIDRQIPLIRHPWLLRDNDSDPTTNRQIPLILRPCLLTTQQPQPAETRVQPTTIECCTPPIKAVNEPTRLGRIHPPRDNPTGLVPPIHSIPPIPSERRIEQIHLNPLLHIRTARGQIPLNLPHRVRSRKDTTAITTTDVRLPIPLTQVSALVPVVAITGQWILPIIHKSE